MHLTLEIILALAAVCGWTFFLIQRARTLRQLRAASEIIASARAALTRLDAAKHPGSTIARPAILLAVCAALICLLALLRRKSPAPLAP